MFFKYYIIRNITSEDNLQASERTLKDIQEVFLCMSDSKHTIQETLNDNASKWPIHTPFNEMFITLQHKVYGRLCLHNIQHYVCSVTNAQFLMYRWRGHDQAWLMNILSGCWGRSMLPKSSFMLHASHQCQRNSYTIFDSKSSPSSSFSSSTLWTIFHLIQLHILFFR